ncbi:MAG: T9SS type A sorting domain-containing protein [Bacteroidales bacterium]|nr:T9SS type A sorting domain-containing protein [Bacteroidales bacterium]
MKKIVFLLTISVITLISYSQDIIDPYDEDELSGVTWTSVTGYYDGEYQIELKRFLWRDILEFHITDYYAMSYQFECVSFPFVPDCFNINATSSGCVGSSEGEGSEPLTNDRAFHVLSDEYFGDINNSNTGNGTGWIHPTTNRYVYSFTEPLEFYTQQTLPHYPKISKKTRLVSHAYAGDESPITLNDYVVLPHTVLRVTLNIHDGETIEDPILVTLSWLYDNTRGRMKSYPFIDDNGGTNEKEKYDVVFRPYFIYDGYPNNSAHTYATTTNVGWFTGAHPPSINPLGSINYYHQTDVPNQHPYYPTNPPTTDPFPYFDEFGFIYFYPAPFSLLSPSLRNSNFSAYAGFDEDGLHGSGLAVEDGIEHTYTINEPIDLTLINPSEKIIYNPSKVKIDCDLTFPACYKFLTVHGKYPDKAWVMYNNLGLLSDLRDVLTPSDQQEEQLSEYEIPNGSILSIEPGVTIMDAKFTGSGTIRYNPYRVNGNFQIGPNINTIITTDDVICIFHKSSPPINDSIENTENVKVNFEIYPNPIKNEFYIRNTSGNDLENVKFILYNCIGEVILVKNIGDKGFKKIILPKELNNGIYNAVIIVNGKVEKIEKLIVQ